MVLWQRCTIVAESPEAIRSNLMHNAMASMRASRVTFAASTGLQGGVRRIQWQAFKSRKRRAELRSARGLLARAERSVTLEVEGMKCGGCTSAVKHALESVDGVEEASVNLATGTASVKVAEGISGDEAVKRGMERAAEKGFPAREQVNAKVRWEAHESREREEADKRRNQLVWAWILGGTCIAVHMSHHAMHNALPEPLSSPLFSGVLATAALLGPGRDILSEGFQAVLSGRPDMNTLVGAGAVTAYSLSAAGWLNPQLAIAGRDFFHEPAMLLAFVMLGRSLEAEARASAKSDLRGLGELLPPEARVLDGAGNESKRPIEQIGAGDSVVVLPGEKFPVDGVVLDGRGEADESILTGEFMRVSKRPDDSVSAGTISYGAKLVIRAEAVGEDCKAAGIRRLVEDAQLRPANAQRLADRVAGVFSAGILGTAGATFAFWAWLGQNIFPGVVASAGVGSGLALAARLAADVTVVACPCALGLATPTAVLVATSVGAKKGLLIKGGDVLDSLAQIDWVALDKTGTLTHGRPEVSRVVSLSPNYGPNEIAQLASAVESGSSHPVAQAITTYSASSQPSGQSVQTYPGEGVVGDVGGRLVAVGEPAFVVRQVHGTGSGDFRELTGAADSETAVAVGVHGDGIVGAICLEDGVRAGARSAIDRLISLGVTPELLSGDAPATVAAVAGRLGIPPERAQGGVSPQGKAEAIQARQTGRDGRRVLAVGDGINDGPALAVGHASIAMRNQGDSFTTVQSAEEAAGVVSLRPDLHAVPDAVELARDFTRTVRTNLLWAVGYNAVGVPVAAGALLPSLGFSLDPSLAGLAMALSSLAVVTNSVMLRARWLGFGAVLPKRLSGQPSSPTYHFSPEHVSTE